MTATPTISASFRRAIWQALGDRGLHVLGAAEGDDQSFQ